MQQDSIDFIYEFGTKLAFNSLIYWPFSALSNNA